MPKLWNDTIEAHRQAVRDAILDATAGLVARHGPASVTMSPVATESGIGRATLYKYFTDVDAILLAWHERQVATHLAELTAVRDGPGDATERLRAVLSAYARNAHHRHGGDVTAWFAVSEQVPTATSVTAVPRTVQIESVVPAYVTGRPDDAVAAIVTGL